MNHGPRLAKGELLILLGLFLAAGIGFGLHWSFTIDDAAISFSYARNFAAGNGLGALYPGAPRVEGYSNLLWVILLAAGSKLGLETMFVSKLLGLVFTLGIMFVLFLSLRRFIAQTWLLAGIVLLPISLTFSFWSASGLENSLYAFLILLSIHFLIEEEMGSTRRVPFASALSLVLVGMTRPEGLIYAFAGLGYKVLQLLLHWKSQETRKVRMTHLFLWLGVFIFGYGLFKAWHYGYFAAWWPNPIYAKAGWYRLDLEKVWFEPAGWVYLRGFFRTFGGIWMIPALIFGGLVSLKGPQRIFLLFALAALVLPLYTPDWMIHYRFVYPFLPMGAALLILAADQLWTWIFHPNVSAGGKTEILEGKPLGVWLRIGAGVLALFFSFGVAYYAWANLRLTQRQLACGFAPLAETRCLDGRMYWTMSEVDQKYGGLVDIANQLGLSEPLYMIPDIGATSYVQNKRILDLAGLGDYQMARIREGNLLKQYIFEEQRPDIVMTYGIWTRRTDLTTFQAFQDRYLPVEKGIDDNGLTHGTFVRKDLVIDPPAAVTETSRCELAPGLFLVQASNRLLPGINGAHGGFDTFWVTNTSQASDWQFEIRLLDQNGVQVDRQIQPLGYGWYPASEWQVGELFRQYASFPVGLPAGGYSAQIGLINESGDPAGPGSCEIALNIPDIQVAQQNAAESSEILLSDAQMAWRAGDIDQLLTLIQQSIEVDRLTAGLPTLEDRGAIGRSAEWHSLAKTLAEAAGESAKQADWQRAYKLYLAASLANPADAWAQHGLELTRRRFVLGPQTGLDAPVGIFRLDAHHLAASSMKD